MRYLMMDLPGDMRRRRPRRCRYSTLIKMASLGHEHWMAIRAQWEIGLLSERALARCHGINRMQIRRRRVHESWQRNPVLPTHVITAAKTRAAEALAGMEVSMRQQSVTALDWGPRRPLPTLVPDTRELVRRDMRATATEAAIATIGEVKLAQLQSAARLRRLAVSYAERLGDILDGTPTKACQAAEPVLAGRSDSVAMAPISAARSALEIQCRS